MNCIRTGIEEADERNESREAKGVEKVGNLGGGASKKKRDQNNAT